MNNPSSLGGKIIAAIAKLMFTSGYPVKPAGCHYGHV